MTQEQIEITLVMPTGSETCKNSLQNNGKTTQDGRTIYMVDHGGKTYVALAQQNVSQRHVNTFVKAWASIVPGTTTQSEEEAQDEGACLPDCPDSGPGVGVSGDGPADEVGGDEASKDCYF